MSLHSIAHHECEPDDRDPPPGWEERQIILERIRKAITRIHELEVELAYWEGRGDGGSAAECELTLDRERRYLAKLQAEAA